jgi:hypothetical protein
MLVLTYQAGRAVAQAVSRGFSPLSARVRPLSGHVGIVVDKVALGQVFSEYFCFPCQFSFHRLLHIYHHLHALRYNRLISGRRTKWAQSDPPPHKETKKKKNYLLGHTMSNSEYHIMNSHRRKNRTCCVLDALLNFMDCVA